MSFTQQPGALDNPIQEDLVQDTYPQALARALWFRTADRPSRFLFAADSPQGLVITPLTPGGAKAFAAATRAFVAAKFRPQAGAFLVDADGDAVFCVDTAPEAFLARLAEWATRHAADIPALATLQGCGAAQASIAYGQDDAVSALAVEALDIHRDPALWTALQPDTASVAAILAPRLPGERMWFWLCSDVPGGMTPLLLQPVAWDPNRDRLDGQIRLLEADGAGVGATGFALFVEDGRLQFAGAGLEAGLLVELADWVREEQAAHPALSRLAHCQLVSTYAGAVISVLEDPALWAGITPPPAPGTMSEAAAQLAALTIGGSLWVWLTRQAPGGAFIAFAPVTGDADAHMFGAYTQSLFQRFPQSFTDAVTGVLTRGEAGLVLTHHGADPAQLTSALAAAALHPGLDALKTVRIVDEPG